MVVLVVRRPSCLVVAWSRRVCRGFASALLPTLLVSAGVVVPAALASEGLIIPTGPCSRGSPPFFLQLGACHHGSSVSDGLRRRLWRRVLSAAVRASVVSSCT
ncbi:hypothetical protein Taro_043476 [Colocasia esculenta]|uniref:Uncharacterized protein n=1 Tax=Colocasia esculenta TaxID=4460 RepID=A0A843X1L6_COLES|nr:hypothetical protein [Colocasia esculenta]